MRHIYSKKCKRDTCDQILFWINTLLHDSQEKHVSSWKTADSERFLEQVSICKLNAITVMLSSEKQRRISACAVAHSIGAVIFRIWKLVLSRLRSSSLCRVHFKGVLNVCKRGQRNCQSGRVDAHAHLHRLQIRRAYMRPDQKNTYKYTCIWLYNNRLKTKEYLKMEKKGR